MDVISFSEAATANSRIESFIENPDSSSGIVTVPKTIASGETVTIPAGRVAVLPNLVIDGVLNIENGGEVFIPSGATLGDLETQLALKAPLVNPAFTNPTATTQTAQDNSTKVATTAYVDGKMVLGTAVNSTSGTSIDFTGIPSWAKKITVMFSGVSTNGSTPILIRLGTVSSIETTGYISIGSAIQGSVVGVNFSDTSFLIGDSRGPTFVEHGNATINKLTNNNYCFSGIMAQTGGANYRTVHGAGSKTLSGVLDRIRITTANGTDMFDAGSINILYEG